jgi:hypothetical protein
LEADEVMGWERQVFVEAVEAAVWAAGPWLVVVGQTRQEADRVGMQEEAWKALGLR